MKVEIWKSFVMEHWNRSHLDAILNTGLTNNVVDDEWELDDFDFREDDVRKGVFDGVPSIEFFDRFYALVEKSNDYYFAKFESTLDYNNVLSKGPWVIFGHYLTVQPWSTQFSICKAFPQCIMAWAVFQGSLDHFKKGEFFKKLGA
ncbi:hypothetical protein GOBAR_DD12027 [Gossypium barbadense]|nr:hypothetical protein GOBAR_DD12027 [Gossypium barbadense]